MKARQKLSMQATQWRNNTALLSDDVPGWEDVMPLVIHLYTRCRFRLETVRQTLANEYNFIASTQTYKRRLAACDVRKNMTIAEKELILNYRRHTQIEGRRLCRPVYKHKRRHYLCGNPLDARLLSLSSNISAIEQVFTISRQYYQIMVESATSSIDHHWSIGESFNLVSKALDLSRVNLNDCKAYAMLEKVCEKASKILQRRHEAVVLFAAYLSQAQWAHIPQARALVTQNFVKIAERVDSHLAHVLAVMLNDEVSNFIGSKYLELVAEVARAKPSCSAGFIEYFSQLYTSNVRFHGSAKPKINFLMDHIRRADESGDLGTRIRFRYVLVQLNLCNSSLEQSERWAIEGLRLVKGNRKFWRHERGTLFQLGRIRQAAQDYNEAARCYRGGIILSLQPEVYPAADRFDRYVTLEFLEILETMYRYQANDAEAARSLRAEFGQKWTEYAEEFKGVTANDPEKASGSRSGG